MRKLFEISTHNPAQGPAAYSQLCGGAKSVFIAEAALQAQSNSLVLCDGNQSARQMAQEIRFFAGSGAITLFFPDTETLPYDRESPHGRLISDRACIIRDLVAANDGQRRIVVTSIQNASRRISGIDFWRRSHYEITCGQPINLPLLAQALHVLGYRSAGTEVSTYADYELKGGVLDVFASGSDQPVRIVAENGLVKSIRHFSVVTQRSGDHLESINILPVQQMPADPAALAIFRRRFRQEFGRTLGDPMYEGVLSGSFPAGVESLLPLFQSDLSSIYELIGDDGLHFYVGATKDALSRHYKYIEHRHHELQMDKQKALSPEKLWLGKDEMEHLIAQRRLIDLGPNPTGAAKAMGTAASGVDRKPGLEQTLELLDELFKRSKKVIFCLHSKARLEQLHVLCEMADVELTDAPDWHEALQSKAQCVSVTAPIDTGFYHSASGTLVVAERELFGRAVYAKIEDNLDEGLDYEKIQDLASLEVGDPVVHVKFGVGRYGGLSVMQIDGIDREYMKIHYASDATAIVPMDELDYVSRYGGMSTEKAPLGVMGSQKWTGELTGALENIRTTARELALFQQIRHQRKGISFKRPTFSYQKFCREFPFQETRDQAAAVMDIIDDMTSERMMDRIIVGDVGFGKTEVAMRAAFIAASSGYQVAVMVPTTLLAQQHHNTFTERFEDFPIVVECLARSSRASDAESLRKIQNHEVDIVIGTHRLLQDDVRFAKLGLMIIDEEHRFGVQHKEKLKEARSRLDTIAMTATPIPRTLSQSLHGVRDISIIATPPAKRLSIRTIVSPACDELVAEAINREIMRNGQVFYLHNTVNTIEQKAQELRSRFADLKIGIAHGKMRESELETIMARFYSGEFDILVCTTIIETGIDVPNANTIVIEGAQNFGIAQLHQLRGRVGRSHHQAYAYLITTAEDLSDSAFRRLKAIELASNLGEGFVLANHDLEIRGAGEILGDEQSGHIQSIGFALYMRMLKRCMQVLDKGGDLDAFAVDSEILKVDINISGLIDSGYVKNQQARLSFYKRLATMETIEKQEQVADELEDRFGPIPQLTRDLINVSKLRAYLRQVGIRKLIVDESSGYLRMDEAENSIDMDALLAIVDEGGSGFEVNGPSSLSFRGNFANKEDRLQFIVNLLSQITHY